MCRGMAPLFVSPPNTTQNQKRRTSPRLARKRELSQQQHHLLGSKSLLPDIDGEAVAHYHSRASSAESSIDLLASQTQEVPATQGISTPRELAMARDARELDNSEGKCQEEDWLGEHHYQGCPKRYEGTFKPFLCSNKGCNHSVHGTCYDQIVCEGIMEEKETTLDIGDVFCCLECRNEHVGMQNSAAASPTESSQDNVDQQRPVTKKLKCNVHSCPRRLEAEAMVECSNKTCERRVHQSCYSEVVCGRGTKPVECIDGVVFCTLKCQKQYLKDLSEDNLNWTNDGLGGKDDERSSQYYLIQWLTTSNNYAKWRSPSGGKSKHYVGQQAADFIWSKGVKVKRGFSQVNSKIGTMEQQMRDTHRKATGKETGFGIEAEDLLQGVDTIDGKVRACFFRINPVTKEHNSRLFCLSSQALDKADVFLLLRPLATLHRSCIIQTRNN
jgi:hypothetical protein